MGLTSLISPQVPRDSKAEGWPLSSRPCIMQSYFEEGRRTWDVYESGRDRLEWIATRTMVADCLTKSMKSTVLLKVLKENVLTVATAR